MLSSRGGLVALDDIQGAFVEPNTTSDGDPTYYLVLNTAAGDLPLTDTSGSSEDVRNRIRDTINEVLGRTVEDRAAAG